MSNITLNFHSTTKIKASAVTGGDAEWVDMTVIDCLGQESDVVVFFQPRGMAERFAAAINAVNEEAGRIKADLASAGPRLPQPRPDECQADHDFERQHGWAAGR